MVRKTQYILLLLIFFCFHCREELGELLTKVSGLESNLEGQSLDQHRKKRSGKFDLLSQQALRGGPRSQRKGGPENFVLRENLQYRMHFLPSIKKTTFKTGSMAPSANH